MDSSPIDSSSSSSTLSSPTSSPHSAAHDNQSRTLTLSQLEQCKVEERVFEIYRIFSDAPAHTQTLMVELWRDKHIEFLTRGFNQLGPSYHVLDANRPWLCYWILHSRALLSESIDTELENNTIDFLSRCKDKNGGYGGGPGQLPHLATTYAAVNTLVTLGSDAALLSINREELHSFLLRMKDSCGAFRMHTAGEIDVRACYTAISVASILNILDLELVTGLGDYILRCQTYEGGIAGEPGSEAHGGYTFCGLATMILINEVDKLDLSSLIDWVAFRQGVECGFQGRTNKLVDGCYSFWQGGSLCIIQRLLSIAHHQIKSSPISLKHLSVDGNADSASFTGCKPDRSPYQIHDFDGEEAGKRSAIGLEFIKITNEGPLFHSIALQQYILLCSQVLEGGFRDKPGKQRDHYHSCYCLSGLSVCQYSFSKTADSPPLPNAVLGLYSNLLEPIHPLYNVVLEKYYKVQALL
ncbi:Protein farnesyltransferase subunit beta [Platanthera zijinensis]|uniref:Protein farnesyltransferase subunit beta n=1 Tax=Platanthera zijinensis TaxID=2320716 RepID=A0AAP0FZZ9_9ASPA